MEVKTIHLVYFSATYSTRKILRSVAEGFTFETLHEYDITQGELPSIHVPADELLLVGVPVYSGRIPQIALEPLHSIVGKDSPAMIVCVYGNREYDDTLLELKNITEAAHFKVVSAAAFIAQHSIFPQVASERPDKDDMEQALKFGQKTSEIIKQAESIGQFSDIKVKGNFPYKSGGSIPLKPKGSKKCNSCNICVKLCPSQAISKENPRKTDAKKCIACARCIVVCPEKARHFGGLLYKFAGKSFISKYSQRKSAEVYYAV